MDQVPQLVDACARNGFHDEALELANFVNGLERRHLLASEVSLLYCAFHYVYSPIVLSLAL